VRARSARRTTPAWTSPPPGSRAGTRRTAPPRSRSPSSPRARTGACTR
jgi:hypothetical protein